MGRRHRPFAESLSPGGVLHRDDLVNAGVAPALGPRMVRQGQWSRLAPAVWVTSPSEPTDEQRVCAALRHAGENAVVTGLVACRALGLAYAVDDGTISILVPPGRRRQSSAVVRVLPTIRPPQIWQRAGVRYACPPRAIIDAARHLGSLRAVRALILAAVQTRRCSLTQLQDELEAGASGGSAVVRRALTDGALGAWSAPEAEAADLLAPAVADGRLPFFILNPSLWIDGRLIGCPDGWFAGRGFGWDVDSREFHSEEDAFDRTLARHDRFGRYGLALLHVTPRRLRANGTAWADLVVEAVQARKVSGAVEPHGLVVLPHDAPPGGPNASQRITPATNPLPRHAL